MAEDTVICPNCGTEIPITKALKESIESRVKDEFKKQMESEMERKLDVEREKLREDMNEEFRSKYDELNTRTSVKEEHLQEAQKRESEERKKRLELEETLKEQKLIAERQIEEEKNKIRENLRKQYDEEFNLKNREIQQNNESLMKQVQELRLKLEQGSQQRQGEALEIEIEDQLREAFPFDLIIPVPQGKSGPDIIQKVRTQAGIEGGTVAWETKRTKEWDEKWIDKLKEDMVKFGAETGMIVSRALPKGVTSFAIDNGIVITNFESAVPLAAIIRLNILELARQKRLGESSLETREVLYRYLTSTQFRQRVEAIAEGISRMRNDIEAEKRAMERQWARRIKEIEKAVSGISGMFGDLQGIIGPGLATVKSLDLPAEESKENDD